MAFGHWVRRALELPPHVTARKAYALGLRRLREFGERRRDLRGSTYSALPEEPVVWASRFSVPPLQSLSLRAAEIRALSDHARRHEFDLLGSGRRRVERPKSSGEFDRQGRWLEQVVNRANLESSKSVWRMLEGEYAPIDWSVDFKSGHRWPVQQWSPRVDLFPGNGADVKVPWELARMQHLSWLWAAAQLSGARPEFESAESYLREFKNQIIDFVALNPPRYGVNWMCAMDVAIRACGWLVVHDLWRRTGATFGDEWERMFRASVIDHARFVAKHLEWDPQVRGNHYLTNVCGLIVIAAFLPASPEADDWLTFGTTELYRETTLQFFGDGGNFEMSTGYHRLSAEMVSVATAIVASLPEDRRRCLESPSPISKARFRPDVPIPEVSRPLWPVADEHRHRLARIARFAAAVRGRAGPMPIVGDDDSGRFLKILSPHYRLKVKEARRRFVHLADQDWPACRHGYWFEERQADETYRTVVGLLGDSDGTDGILPSTGWCEADLLELAEAPIRANTEIDHWAFPAAGFFALEREHYHAVLRAGDVGQNGNGGHAHNDQLSLTLKVWGDELFIDAGTYVYSADPVARNHYRSTAMHNTLQVDGKEQASWTPGTPGLFRLASGAEARVERFDGQGFEGEHHGFGGACRRKVDFLATSIRGRERFEQPAALRLPFLLAPGVRVRSRTSTGGWSEVTRPGSIDGQVVELAGRDWRVRLSWKMGQAALEPVHVSPAYGALESTWQLAIAHQGTAIDWDLEICL